MVVAYFTSQVANIPLRRPANLDGVPFSSISEKENIKFVMSFSLWEIEVVVKDSDSNKSLNLNGFNFYFFRVLVSSKK